jgi:hypothetical protein
MSTMAAPQFRQFIAMIMTQAGTIDSGQPENW